MQIYFWKINTTHHISNHDFFVQIVLILSWKVLAWETKQQKIRNIWYHYPMKMNTNNTNRFAWELFKETPLVFTRMLYLKSIKKVLKKIFVIYNLIKISFHNNSGQSRQLLYMELKYTLIHAIISWSIINWKICHNKKSQ
jgi:hypothetical protein